MLKLSPPQTQKADKRPIAFVLDDTTSGRTPVVVGLTVRPEDLTRTDPSRMAVHQTLGGAWADNFGAGIPSITISGHTGWRSRLVNNEERDGAEAFAHLYENVFTKWHEQRKDAIRAGHDPDRVRLIYADALDDFAVVVAPLNFTLRRSKSRPLLFQYQIAMTVLSQDIDDLSYMQLALNSAATRVQDVKYAGLESMKASTDALDGYLKEIQKFIDAELVAPVQSFMTKTVALYNKTMESIRNGDVIAAQLIAAANLISAAALNIFRTVAASVGLANYIKVRLMQIAAAYSNIFCVLSNALKQRELIPNYSHLFGSSNCSSTSGGRPLSSLSGVNPFYAYSPTNDPLPVSLDGSAQTNLRFAASNDVVETPMSLSTLVSVVSAISSGMRVK